MGDGSAGGLVHQALQQAASFDDDTEGSALIGWQVVAEWMSPDGRKWMTMLSGDPSGERTIPCWQGIGYAGFADERCREQVRIQAREDDRG